MFRTFCLAFVLRRVFIPLSRNDLDRKYWLSIGSLLVFKGSQPRVANVFFDPFPFEARTSVLLAARRAKPETTPDRSSFR